MCTFATTLCYVTMINYGLFTETELIIRSSRAFIFVVSLQPCFAYDVELPDLHYVVISPLLGV